ncbi:MAG: DUF397 domain-containing protein [Pseudonocardia sp.]
MGSTDPALLRWRKSSRSSGGADNCVEVAEAGDSYALRDSKQHGHGPILTFTHAEWAAFVEGVKLGEFDPR